MSEELTEDYSLSSEWGEPDVILHYGTPRHSGRFPWRSGHDPQRNRSFLNDVDDAKAYLRGQGISNPSGKQIADHLGITTTDLRSRTTLANEELKQNLYEEVHTRLSRGESTSQIAEATGISKGSVRNYAAKDPNTIATKKQTDSLADALKTSLDKADGYLDVGVGVELQLGVSGPKLKATLDKLKEEGYEVQKVWVPQVTNPNQNTTMQVLTKAGVSKSDIFNNLDKIKSVDFNAVDGDSMTLQNLNTPKSLGWDRVKIRYAIPAGEKGHGTIDDGEAMDGSMTIRPSAKDLQFGANKHYAQVRIAVGGSHYLKGVALYGEEKDFPKGVDVIFNTNKKKDKSPQDVLKPLKDKLDGANPFGATIKRQNIMLDDKGNPVPETTKSGKIKLDKKGNPIYQTGALNIVNEEGDWADWSKSLSSQFLSKQPRGVVKERLEATLKRVDDEYAAIQKVNNPVIKKQLLEGYSKDLESKQIHLKAVAPKGFQGHLLLPIPHMKENEIYAPNYKDGDNVILIRYPHGGTFEIPELRVNNKGPGKSIIGNKSPDAVGIHPKVAAKLSGADFDGDTVYVIPNNNKRYKSRDALPGLKNFDPNMYADAPGTFTLMKKQTKQTQMGIVSNLVNDMTLQKASDSEMTRAVRHSMVVIDAEKHKLNYKRSEKENGIDALKKKYQIHIDKVDYSKLSGIDPNTNKVVKVISSAELKSHTGNKKSSGASTVISRRKNQVTTGGQEVEIPNPTKRNPNGTRTVIRKAKKSYITSMLDDASIYLKPNSTQIEKDYVGYINQLKSRKNTIDKEIMTIKTKPRDPKAALIYAEEVGSLKSKLTKSLLNAPKERQAQALATVNYKKEVERRGGKDALGSDDVKKLKNQALIGARSAVGAQRKPVNITPAEWDAIQSNAISASMLKDLVKHMDDKQLKELATPRDVKAISSARSQKAMTLLNNGYTISEVANALGVSSSTISNIKKEN